MTDISTELNKNLLDNLHTIREGDDRRTAKVIAESFRILSIDFTVGEFNGGNILNPVIVSVPEVTLTINFLIKDVVHKVDLIQETH